MPASIIIPVEGKASSIEDSFTSSNGTRSSAMGHDTLGVSLPTDIPGLVSQPLPTDIEGLAELMMQCFSLLSGKVSALEISVQKLETSVQNGFRNLKANILTEVYAQ
ncbi:hypothetical protein NPX13_g9822 [Xylaria arbuscula]|uniref:Uncharacterized protein n=1 Tax=Xylaria arbuscula TaxID=114810 RepID=A0A9W8N5N9_9PEZI|nr:hypothetical protein NPX13_g9822 [Xylaria arbuscula]